MENENASADGAVEPVDSKPIVAMTEVTKRFGTKVALDHVTWAVPSGQICGLLGPNGAGKTTMFRLLMGILKATRGSLTIDGLDAFEDRVALKRLVGFLPDEPVFYSYLSGSEVLKLSAGMHGLDERKTLESLKPLIKRLQLDSAMNQFAEDYSRGMKKKLGILLALLHEPKLLILDEPTNGLDVESTRLFFDLMHELAARGTTILFSTHLMDHVERLCSHAAIIHRGKLIASGSLDELRRGFGANRPLEDVFLEIVGSAAASSGEPTE
jgi:ABC-type multidrug transport system ATPase subunit